MKINKRLALNTWISLGVIILILSSFIWSFLQIQRTGRNKALIDEMQRVVLDRISHRDDYLLHPSERAKTQWQIASDNLRKLLEAASESLTDKKDKILLQEARRDYEATFSTFTELLSIHQQKAKSRASLNETESRIISQLFLKSYALQDSVIRLNESTDKSDAKARSRGMVLVLLFIAGGAMVVAINSFLLNRIVAQRVIALSEGVRTIGEGNLDYRIDVLGNDELSDLGLASNEMAARLKKSYISIEDLNQEIAERELIEENLKHRTEELEEANRELEAFAYSVSHDLQAPLRAIDGFSGMLAKDLQDRLEDDEKRKIKVIRDNAQKMGRLIDDLLAFSRLGRTEVSWSSIDMEQVAKDAWQEQLALNPGRKLELINGKLPRARGDQSLVRQVLSNLLSNAVKFTRNRDQAVIEIGGTTGEGESIYYVRDNGAGFDMKYYDKLFGVFQRLHSDSEYKGNGVGLAILQRIVQRHGGRVWAEGEVGQGATFYFSLPITE